MSNPTTAVGLINRVLSSLRESQIVTSPLTVTTYQAMILEFFNQIKQEVEDATNWRALHQTITVTIPSGNYYAVIPGSNERSRVVRAPIPGGGMSQAGYAPSIWAADKIVALVFDTTSPTTSGQFPLYEMPLAQLLFNISNSNQQQVQQPQFFAIGQGNADNGALGQNEAVLYVYPPVNMNRTVQVTLAVPQSDFSVGASTIADAASNQNILVPSYPILMGVQWMAREERGEELGPTNVFSESKYYEVLDDAVGIEEAEKGNSLDLVLV